MFFSDCGSGGGVASNLSLTYTLQVPGRGQTPHNGLLHQGAGVAGLGRVWSSDDHQGFPHLQVRPQDIPPSQSVPPLIVGEDKFLAPDGGDTGLQFEVRSETVTL